MPTLPMLDKNVNHSPHVVLLGAGASSASFEKGDINGKILPLMNTLIQVVGLDKFLEGYGIKNTQKNFEVLYNDLLEKEEYKEVIEKIDKEIFKYFSSLKIQEEPTIYDYLILSLREKDLIATFNWDPLLLQAYSRNSPIKKLPKLAFLHGDVGVGVCINDKTLGHLNNIYSKCHLHFEPMKLIYPIKKKNYSDGSAIEDQWKLLRNHLEYGYMFTIFGYSAPTEDEEARELMLSKWKSNMTLELAEVEIIDVKSEKEIKERWKDFIFSHHSQIYNNFFDSYLARFPRRSCDAFAESSLMTKFLKDNRFPKFSTLADLHKWIKPLLEEEEKYEKDKTAFTFDSE